MDPQTWNERMDRLERLFERMVSQSPTVNVNVTLDGDQARLKKRPALSSPETEQRDFEPGGMPRPYTS